MKRALPAMFSKVDTLARLVVRSLPTPLEGIEAIAGDLAQVSRAEDLVDGDGSRVYNNL